MHRFHHAVTFANSPLSRESERRGDDAWMSACRADADAMLTPFRDGMPLLGARADDGPVWLRDGAAARAQDPIFLGLDAKRRPRFAADVTGDAALDALVRPLLAAGARFEELRAQVMNGALTGGESAILGQAAALLAWRAACLRCGRCGDPTRAAEGGCKRVCDACARDYFPRTDPVVIMLPVHEDWAFLGRQASWPAGRYSAPAGFMEPGETMEEAVARELHEEARIAVDEVRYVASQPWPFPGALMIGCPARARSRDFALESDELEDGLWARRDDVVRALAGDPTAPLKPPPPAALAHILLRAFVDADPNGLWR